MDSERMMRRVAQEWIGGVALDWDVTMDGDAPLTRALVEYAVAEYALDKASEPLPNGAVRAAFIPALERRMTARAAILALLKEAE